MSQGFPFLNYLLSSDPPEVLHLAFSPHTLFTPIIVTSIPAPAPMRLTSLTPAQTSTCAQACRSNCSVGISEHLSYKHFKSACPKLTSNSPFSIAVLPICHKWHNYPHPSSYTYQKPKSNCKPPVSPACPVSLLHEALHPLFFKPTDPMGQASHLPF